MSPLSNPSFCINQRHRSSHTQHSFNDSGLCWPFKKRQNFSLLKITVTPHLSVFKEDTITEEHGSPHYLRPRDLPRRQPHHQAASCPLSPGLGGSLYNLTENSSVNCPLGKLQGCFQNSERYARRQRSANSTICAILLLGQPHCSIVETGRCFMQ